MECFLGFLVSVLTFDTFLSLESCFNLPLAKFAGGGAVNRFAFCTGAGVLTNTKNDKNATSKCLKSLCLLFMIMGFLLRAGFLHFDGQSFDCFT